jgi:hypothetical protein
MGKKGRKYSPPSPTSSGHTSSASDTSKQRRPRKGSDENTQLIDEGMWRAQDTRPSSHKGLPELEDTAHKPAQQFYSTGEWPPQNRKGFRAAGQSRRTGPVSQAQLRNQKVPYIARQGFVPRGRGGRYIRYGNPCSIDQFIDDFLYFSECLSNTGSTDAGNFTLSGSIAAGAVNGRGWSQGSCWDRSGGGSQQGQRRDGQHQQQQGRDGQQQQQENARQQHQRNARGTSTNSGPSQRTSINSSAQFQQNPNPFNDSEGLDRNPLDLRDPRNQQEWPYLDGTFERPKSDE